MDEHDPQAPNVDTPAQSAPPGTPDEQQIDWQKRYNDLRPQFDRTNQQLAQLNDEEYQRQLMAQWGYEVEEPAPEQGWADPNEELAKQVAELNEWKTQQTQAEQANAQFQKDAEHIGAALQKFQEDIGRELDSEEVRLFGDAAFARRRDDGLPDIDSVLEATKAMRQREQQQWEEARKRPRAPKIASGGQEGTSAPNLNDREQRRAFMAEQLAARET